jgi:hypothetical protein
VQSLPLAADWGSYSWLSGAFDVMQCTQAPFSVQGLMWPTTPLIYASKMGHKDMAALLMDMMCCAYLPVQSLSLALDWASYSWLSEECNAM